MADPAGNLTILEQLAREFEAAHRNREQAMARFPLFPGMGGHSAFSTHASYRPGAPPIPVPSSPPPAGWEFAEHPTERFLREVLSTLHNPVELWRRLVSFERQRQAVKALQAEIDRTTGFVRTNERGPRGYTESSLMLREDLSPLRARIRGWTGSGDSSSPSASSPGKRP